MNKLQFISNPVNKLAYEWPIGTILRRVTIAEDGTREIICTHIVVLEYKDNCSSGLCRQCRSNGRVMSGSRMSDPINAQLYCIGMCQPNGSIQYWEEEQTNRGGE